MPIEADTVGITVDGVPLTVEAGMYVATALLASGVTCFRRSVTGEERAPLCGMGICFECRVTIDGRPHQKACQVVVAPGMEVATCD